MAKMQKTQAAAEKKKAEEEAAALEAALDVAEAVDKVCDKCLEKEAYIETLKTQVQQAPT